MCHIIFRAAGGHGALAAIHGGEVDLVLPHAVAEQDIALAVLGFKQVHKELGRLRPGHTGVGRGDAGGFQQAVGLCLRHVALGPHAAHVLVFIAEAPHENRHRLSGGHGLSGLEFTIGKAGDDSLSGGHVDISGRPVGGLHIREDSHGGIPAQLAAAIHGVYRHLTKLCPVQHGVRPERPVAVAIQHAHEPQRLNGCGGVAVADIGKFRNRGRPHRHSQ